VSLDDVFGDSQAQASAAARACPVGLVETLKDAGQIVSGDAHASVFY